MLLSVQNAGIPSTRSCTADSINSDLILLGNDTLSLFEDVPLLWNAPSGRIIYQFAPDESSSEDGIYSASMNDTVKKFYNF